MRYLRFNGIIIYFTTKTTKILSSGVHFNTFMVKKKIRQQEFFQDVIIALCVNLYFLFTCHFENSYFTRLGIGVNEQQFKKYGVVFITGGLVKKNRFFLRPPLRPLHIAFFGGYRGVLSIIIRVQLWVAVCTFLNLLEF